MVRKVVILNGYDIRDDLKRYGATFRAADKAWLLSQAGYDKLIALVGKTCHVGFRRGFAKIVVYSEL